MYCDLRWTWYQNTFRCLLYEDCHFLDKNSTYCGCFTAPKCQEDGQTTAPTLVGGVESVEVLLERGPSLDVIPDLPEERQFPVVASIGDKVFLCGGTDGFGVAKSTCFYYSFYQGKWIEMDNGLPKNISRSAGVAAYGDFYILGGQMENGEPTNAVRNICARLSL